MSDGLSRLGIEGVDRRSGRWFWRWLGPLVAAAGVLLGVRQLGLESWLDRPLLLLALIVPTLVIGLLAAAIWWGRRRERAFLWLALACVAGCVYSLPRLVDPAQLPLPAPALSIIALAVYISTSVVLGLHLFGRRLPGLRVAMAAVVGLVSLSMGVISLAWPAWLPAAAVAAYGVLVLYGFTLNLVVYVWEHLRRPTPLSFVMQVTAHCMGATVLWEAALLPGQALWQTPAWFLLMAPLAVVVVTFWLMQRFGQALGEAERWALTLEDRVAAREVEIADSYQRLKAAEQAQAIASERERVAARLRELGYTVLPSESNFLFFGRFADQQRVWQQFLDKEVLIRDVGIAGHLRMTVGLPEENSAFLAVAEDLADTVVADNPAGGERSEP